MDPMLPRIILFFLWQLDYLRCFSVRVILFLINSHSISSENSFLLPFCFFFNFCVSINLSRLLVVKRWQEININISINDANSIIIIFGSDLKNIDFKFFVKDSDRDGIALMQASKIPELMFEDGSWIGQLNEFGHVWLKPNHMPSNVCLLLQIMDESDCTWSSWLWKFQHFKHPIRDVAQAFFSYKLQHSAVCQSHVHCILYAKSHRVFVLRTQQRIQLIQSRRWQQYFITFLDILSKGK